MPRRRPMTKGPWDDPVSPLQAARFARRQTRQEIVDLVHQVCRGRGGEECKLDADKLGEYERGDRRPGIEHVTAFCRVFNKSPEELGLIRWRDEPRPPEAEAAAKAPPEEGSSPTAHLAQPSGADDPQVAATNGTNQTSIRYPGDAESQLLTFSGDMLAVPVDPTGQDVPAGRELEVSAAVERIQFVKAVGTVAGAVVADPIIAAAQRTRDKINFTKVSDIDIDRLAEAAYHHARNYYQLGDPGRRDALLFDWATAGRLLDLQATHRQRRDLFDAYARLCGIVGFLSFDRDEIARAKVLLETGQAAAKEAGNGDLLAWLLDRSSLIAEQAENDPFRVLSLTGRGLEAIGRPTTLIAAKLHGRMACAHAVLGDRPAALASLDNASAALGSASPGCWPSEASMPRGFLFATDILATDIGDVRLSLGDLAEAMAACEQAALLLEESLGPGAAKTSSAIPRNQFNLAMALAGAGELEGACQTASKTLTTYEGVAKAVVIRRARRFERGLASHQPSPHSREFSELLRDRERVLQAGSLRH